MSEQKQRRSSRRRTATQKIKQSDDSNIRNFASGFHEVGGGAAANVVTHELNDVEARGDGVRVSETSDSSPAQQHEVGGGDANDSEDSGDHGEEGLRGVADEGVEEADAICTSLEGLSISFNNGESYEDNNNGESYEDDNDGNDARQGFCRYCKCKMPRNWAELLPLQKRLTGDSAQRYFGRHYENIHNGTNGEFNCLVWGASTGTKIFKDINSNEFHDAFSSLNEEQAREFIAFFAIARSFLQYKRDIIEEVRAEHGIAQRHEVIASYINKWREILHDDQVEARRALTRRPIKKNYLESYNWEDIESRLDDLSTEIQSTLPLTEEALEACVNNVFDFAPSNVLAARHLNTIKKSIFHRLNDVNVLMRNE
jgi:hypothetical protein